MAKNLKEKLFVAATRGSWRMLDWHADEADLRYADVRRKILERDDYRCVFCGFRSEKFQHLHHLNHDHGSNASGNVVTCCPLCHQCFHLGLSSVKKSGVMIWAPEISQADINNIARACFIAVHDGSVMESAARDLYTALEGRAETIEENFGLGTSDPKCFAQAFVEMHPDLYSARRAKFPGLRLLPRMQGFAQEIEFWSHDKSVFAGYIAEKWGDLMPELSEEKELVTDEGDSPSDL